MESTSAAHGGALRLRSLGGKEHRFWGAGRRLQLQLLGGKVQESKVGSGSAKTSMGFRVQCSARSRELRNTCHGFRDVIWEDSCVVFKSVVKFASCAALVALCLVIPQEALALVGTLMPDSQLTLKSELVEMPINGASSSFLAPSLEGDDDFDVGSNVSQETDLSLRLSDEILELYRLRSQSRPLGQSEVPSRPRHEEKKIREPVLELTEELKAGCGGPQCVAILLRPSATLEGTFFVGLITMGFIAQRRGQAAKQLEELVSAGEQQRQRSEEAMRSLQKRLQAQESVILDLLQGKPSNKSRKIHPPIIPKPYVQSQRPGKKGVNGNTNARKSLLSEQLIADILSPGGSEDGSVYEDVGLQAVKVPELAKKANKSPPVSNVSRGKGKDESKEGKLWLHRQSKSLSKEKTEGKPSQHVSLPLNVVYGRMQEVRNITDSSDGDFSSDAESGSDSEEGSPLDFQDSALRSPSPRSRTRHRPSSSKVTNQSQSGGNKVSPRRAPTSWAPPRHAEEKTGETSPELQSLMVIPDTNCYVRSLRYVRLLRKLPNVQTVVPLAVLGELDGLQQNGDPKTSFAARKAVRFFANEMALRGSWLRGQRQSEKLQREAAANRERVYAKSTHTEGNTATAVNWQKQWKQNAAGKLADDEIIDCCLYFVNQGRSVVLITDDKALQVKALFNDLQVFPLVQYLEDNLTLFDKRYLK